MKDIKDLSIFEVDKLTYEEVSAYRKLVLANAGIPISTDFGELDKIDIEEIDGKIAFQDVYLIEQLDKLVFTSADVATEVLKFINSKSQFTIKSRHAFYTINNGYVHSIDNTASAPVVSSGKFILKDELEFRNKEVNRISKLNSKIKENVKAKLEYDTRVNEILTPIDTFIKECTTEVNRLNHLVELVIDDYLQLSIGDLDVALNFLAKAYTISDEDRTYIRAVVSFKINSDNK